MKPIYTQEQFNSTKSKDLLKCECYHCDKTFTLTKHDIQRALNLNNKNKAFYCSRYCKTQASVKKVNVICLNCNLEFTKKLCEIKKTKSGNHFCSRSCSASYNNKHKTHGNRRSKLEKWLEEQLTNFYPNLIIHFNKKGAIGSELDIYIPHLNLAFELNGIFHYEPIYGVNKLDQIQSNDSNKFQKCIENKIDLCIIDTSQQTYVKPSTSQKYLDIINHIIKERLSII